MPKKNKENKIALLTDDLLDSITIVNDGIHSMNLRLADMLPTSDFQKLREKRDEALDRLDFLIKLFIKGSTQRFVKADSELAVVNEEMKETLASLKSMQKVLADVTRFISAIDTFIGAISKIV